MRPARVLVVVLVLLMALPPLGVIPVGSEATRSPGASGVLAQGADQNEAGAERARERKARKQGKGERRDVRPRVQTPPIDPAAKEQTRRGRSDRDQGPTKRERKRDWQEKCDTPGSIQLPQSRECTHGPDHPPPGVDVARDARPVSAAAARNAQALLVCDGDGKSGPRVQVLYVRASDVPGRFATFQSSFQVWAAGVDQIVQESAKAVGGKRRVRFVTTSGCAIDVRQVVLSPAGDNSFDKMVSELKAKGFNRTDRKYLIFGQITSNVYCGLGSRWDDDDRGQANWNNYGPSYALTYSGCWDDNTPAHELMHNFGGVQHSAPNSSHAGHCIDDYDVMCYDDSDTAPPMRIDCPNRDFEYRYDCGYNDYFNPVPRRGSYLATHWNTANSRFLVGGGNGANDTAAPVVNWLSPVGNGQTHRASAGNIALKVSASDEAGVNRVEFWRYDAKAKKWILLATDRTAPYTSTLDISTLPLGYNQIDATVYDGVLNWRTQHIWIQRVRG